MLTADQVRPFLCHEYDFVRAQALDYFAEAAQQPHLPAADVWSVVEKYGPDNLVLLALRKAAHSPSSTDRLIEFIVQGGNQVEPWVLEKLLAALPIEHLELVATHPIAGLRISKKARLIIDGRRQLVTRGHSDLWNELSVYAQHLETADPETLEYDDGLLIVDAIARQDGGAATRVMDLILDPKTTGSWMEMYMIDLAGLLGLEAAIPFLLDVVGQDGDLVNEHAARALGKIGTTALAAEIAARYADASVPFQSYTPSALTSMRTNEAELALVRILEICRDDPEQVTMVASDLCEMGTTLAMPRLLDIVEKADFAQDMVPLAEHVLALAIMQGLDVPWAQACHQQRLERQRRVAARKLLPDGGRRAPNAEQKRVWVSSSKKRKGARGKQR